MGLKINNRATPKQEVLLTDLGYIKSTHGWPLTQEQAAEIIDGLLENKRHDELNDAKTYGSIDELTHSPEELEDPFNNVNKRSKGA